MPIYGEDANVKGEREGQKSYAEEMKISGDVKIGLQLIKTSNVVKVAYNNNKGPIGWIRRQKLNRIIINKSAKLFGEQDFKRRSAEREYGSLRPADFIPMRLEKN